MAEWKNCCLSVLMLFKSASICMVEGRVHTWSSTGSLLALPPAAGIDIVGVVFLVASLNLHNPLVRQ